MHGEFCMVIFHIVIILNSFSLHSLSPYLDNYAALKSHFLIERPITNIPQPNRLTVSGNSLKPCELLTKINQNIWEEWSINTSICI